MAEMKGDVYAQGIAGLVEVHFILSFFISNKVQKKAERAQTDIVAHM